MSSLQCPARIFLVNDPASLRPAQARGLADRLASERIARVWCGPRDATVQTARAMAEALTVDVVVSEQLVSLDEVADAHPGEAVLVISDEWVEPVARPGYELVDLVADADG